jgi:CobQ-like glutamine amidotransferase family enzyme
VRTLAIAHLYPREMNIYGDVGNVITLVKRLEWRGFAAEVRPVEIGEPFDLSAADIIFGGGGQDSGQLVVGQDLLERGAELRHLAAAGVPMLVVCGLYQLFGRGFTTLEGQEIPGISVFRASTVGSKVRMIGNVTVKSQFGELVGFENHSGQTILEPEQQSLGEIVKGWGNNPTSRREGAISLNAIGTYLHGPILPKNPALADHLLLTALQRRFGIKDLEPMNNRLEIAAARVADGRPR